MILSISQIPSNLTE